MADDAKADDLVDQLRDNFADNIRKAVTGLPAHQALQLADTLCRVQLDVLAGLRVSYKAAPKVDADAVAEDWMQGMPLKEIMRKHGISKTTAYQHHPGKQPGRRRTG